MAQRPRGGGQAEWSFGRPAAPVGRVAFAESTNLFGEPTSSGMQQGCLAAKSELRCGAGSRRNFHIHIRAGCRIAMPTAGPINHEARGRPGPMVRPPEALNGDTCMHPDKCQLAGARPLAVGRCQTHWAVGRARAQVEAECPSGFGAKSDPI